jgi:ABC-type transport system involved in multi-copper enzyme maturation permease subunit
MIRLVRAEWTKLFTTRVWWGLLLGACAMAGGFVAIFTAFAGQTGQNGQPGIPAVGTRQYEQLAFAAISNATVLLLILGIIGMTQEYRHRTATPTFLAAPRRWQVVVAKLVAYALATVAFAVAIVGTGVLVAEIYGGARGAAPSLTDAANLRVLGGVFAALVIYAVIGVGVGALLRNQVGAIVGSLVYLFVVEGILIQAIPPLRPAYKWLPGGALQAVTATLQGQGPDVLERWQGALLLLGYGLVAALLGTLFAVRRDVT